MVNGNAEIIKEHTALTYSLKPKDLEEAAEKACKLKATEINTIFPDVSLSAVQCLHLMLLLVTLQHSKLYFYNQLDVKYVL